MANRSIYRGIVKYIILVLLLTGCRAYYGKVTTPDGKEYIVEQSTAGSIKIKDGGIEIEADTRQPSFLQRLIDSRVLREAEK